VSEPTRDAQQDEVDRSLPPDPPVEYGTVGHDGVDELLDQGTSGKNDENGPSFVRITLYSGKPDGVLPKPGAAQGRPIFAHLLGPLLYCPPRGTRVAVCWPEGRRAPALMLGTVGFSPTAQFKENRAMLDVGPEHELVLKAAVVTAIDHGDSEDTPRFNCFFSVGRSLTGGDPGIVANDPTGSGFTIAKAVVGFFATDAASPPDAKAILQLAGPSSTNPGFGIMYKGAALMKADADGNVSIGCGKALALVGAQVLIGAGATPMTPALWGLSGVSGVPSTSVFISK
jgi:hypothetical protein